MLFRSAIDAAIKTLAPGERALTLAFSTASPGAGHPYAYIHYPAWYQAERQGLVDFNFAWFPPQIVRWRPDRAPPVTPGFEWYPEKFDWHRHEGWRYFIEKTGLKAGTDPAEATQHRQAELEGREANALRDPKTPNFSSPDRQR